MALIIRKKSNFTFEHYFNGATVPYITNVFNINNGGNETFQLVDYRGANLQAVPINQITLYDDTTGGSAETFTTFAQLNTRLGQLNYPPMRGENAIPSDFNLRVQEDEETPIQNVNKIIFSGATVTDNADGSVTVTITGGIGSQTFQQVYDASDPPVINAERNGGLDTYNRVIGAFSEGQFVSTEQIGSETEIEGDNHLISGSRSLIPTDSGISTTKENTVSNVQDRAVLGSQLAKVNILEQKLKDGETATVKIGFEDLDEPTTTQTWDWQVPKDETPGTIKFASRAWVEDNFSGGGVESITGDGVDNTDPDNPVISFPTPSEIGAEPDLGFTPENVANKATNLTSPDNTKYPTTQAVVNALALKSNLENVEQIIRSKSNGTFGSHTGNTAETVIQVIDIDANEFEAGDWMTLLFSLEKDAIVGNVTLRLRAGVNGNTSDNQIAILTATAANSRYSALYRGRPQFLTGNQLRIWSTLSTSSTDISVSGAPTLFSLTPTSAWKLTVTAQLTIATETASLTGYRIGKIKSF